MRLAILSFILVLLSGCSNSISNIQRVDTKAIYLTTIHWSSEDLQMMAEAMIVSILKSGVLDDSSKKVFSFLKIKNTTYDHIDTKSIIETIKISLIKSDRVTIIDMQKREILNQELEYQKSQQRYFQEIKKIGKQLGVDGIFFGDISAIYQKNSLSKDMFFKFTLNLVDIKSAQIIWSEEKEVRKIYKKRYLGW